jgi:Bacterial virulence factor lipase N-terminal
MTFFGGHVVLASAMCFVLLCPPPVFARVQAKFSLDSPAGGPFPSDRFTIADPSQNTGRRVNLPIPDCAVRQSDCEDLVVINTLDGFHIEPRLSIPFDGPIDVTTVTSEAVFLVSLDDGDGATDRHRVIGINQVVWDTFTNTLYVQTNELLDQHARYVLVATKNVLDVDGKDVKAAKAFLDFVDEANSGSTGDSAVDAYRTLLRNALTQIDAAGVVPRGQVVTASLFTTQSVTAVLEKIRDQIKAARPEPADFHLGPGGSPTVFALDTVAEVIWNQQTGNDPPPRVTLDVPLLRIFPGAVGTIAFGKYTSPDYEFHPGEFIPPIGTRTGTPVVYGTNEIYFNLFLPSGDRPAAGWPVAILGHGNNENKNTRSLMVAATMAAHGIATVAINAAGHGFGLASTLVVKQTNSESVTFSAGGRGVDQNDDDLIANSEGFAAAPPRTIVFFGDGIRQTVADLMQLVRVIEMGMDVDGDGSPDLDPSRIYYVGFSLGSNYGTVFLSVDPSVRAGVLSSPGGPIIENRRLSPITGRSVLGQALASRIPSLVNGPGITRIAGVLLPAPHFDENFPLRDGIPLRIELADGTSQEIQSPVINTVAGAMAIQEVIENTKWVARAGDPVAYAPYIRKTPLPGVPAKSVIYQFAKGDQTTPNPSATAILRAGDLADRTTLYRHDLAYAAIPTLPKNPHTFMIATNVAAFRPVALGAQKQIAVFFSTGKIIHPDPSQFFDVPIVLPLPEDFNFIP